MRSGGWVAVLDHRRGVDVEDRCLGEGIARTDLIDELRGTVVCAEGPDRAKAKQRVASARLVITQGGGRREWVTKAQCHVVTGVAHGEWSVDAGNYPNSTRRLQRVTPVGLEPTPCPVALGSFLEEPGRPSPWAYSDQVPRAYDTEWPVGYVAGEAGAPRRESEFGLPIANSHSRTDDED